MPFIRTALDTSPPTSPYPVLESNSLISSTIGNTTQHDQPDRHCTLVKEEIDDEYAQELNDINTNQDKFDEVDDHKNEVIH